MIQGGGQGGQGGGNPGRAQGGSFQRGSFQGANRGRDFFKVHELLSTLADGFNHASTEVEFMMNEPEENETEEIEITSLNE